MGERSEGAEERLALKELRCAIRALFRARCYNSLRGGA